MATQYLLFSIVATTSFSDVTWQYSTSSTSLLPYSYATFYGYDGDSIFILGGVSYGTTLVEYNTASDTYTSHSNSITFGYQNAQSVAQIGSTIYMLAWNTITVTAFNLNTLQVTQTLTYPSNSNQGCLVAFADKIDNYIVGIGGWDGVDYIGNVYIYNITDSTWTSGANLPTARYRMSCSAVGDAIYLFGGHNGNFLDDIWKYQWNGPWTKLNAKLSQTKFDSRSVVFETDIFIIGGAQGSSSTSSLDGVDVLDTMTDTISSVHSLIAAKYASASIVIPTKNIIYVFGGYPYPGSTTTYTYYQYGIIDTLTPTKTPTQSPISSPTKSPTMSPTNSPISPPTATPTIPPTMSPTNSPLLQPTMSPTQSPSLAPTNPPTNAPSISPTFSPTNSPTKYPTNAPTFSPTLPPTNTPTFAPTRYPTSVTEYDLKVAVIFQISRLTETTEKDIVESEIIAIIETNYVETEEKIEYRDFEIKIDAVEEIDDFIPILAVNLSGFVNYRQDSFIDLFSYTSTDNVFIHHVEDDLFDYFNNETVDFYVWVDDGKVYEKYTATITSTDFVFYALMGIVLISVILSILAFTYNRKEDSKVDDADYLALSNVGLCSFDLITDILLAREIVLQFQALGKDGMEEDYNDYIFLYIAVIGSIIFVVVPYLINIAIVIKIETFVSGNKSASLYFKQYRGLFVLLMLFTGSVHSALKLLSSRIYGIDLFNSGLTKYELMKLAKLRLFGSILIENLPQLIVQVLYSMYTTQPSQLTVLSFVASALSILAVIISYLLQCRISDCQVVQYELEIKLINSSNSVLSDDQISTISQKKECKKKLGKSLSAALNVEFGAVEFGFVKVTNIGLIINMIHYVFKSDLLNGHDSNKWVYNLYQTKQTEVNTAFINHFGFNVDVKCKNFDVKVTVIELKDLKKVNKWSIAGKKMVTLISRIEILFNQNYSTDYVEKQLVNEGYDKNVVSSILSTYSRFPDQNDSETGDNYIPHQNQNDYVLLNDIK